MERYQFRAVEVSAVSLNISNTPYLGPYRDITVIFSRYGYASLVFVPSKCKLVAGMECEAVLTQTKKNGRLTIVGLADEVCQSCILRSNCGPFQTFNRYKAKADGDDQRQVYEQLRFNFSELEP